MNTTFRSANINPFRVSKLESLDWIAAPQSLEEIFNEWSLAEFKGQLVGKHGSGKTTLAHHLINFLEQNGYTSQYLFANLDSLKNDFKNWDETIQRASDNTIFIFDGIGHAPFFKRRKWLASTKHFLALVHTPLKNIPVTGELTASVSMLEKLTYQLAGSEGLQLLEISGGSQFFLNKNKHNLRDCFFDLYKIWANTK